MALFDCTESFSIVAVVEVCGGTGVDIVVVDCEGVKDSTGVVLDVDIDTGAGGAGGVDRGALSQPAKATRMTVVSDIRIFLVK